MKINPYNLTRPVPSTETKTFIDPLHPDQPLELTLKNLDSAETVYAMEVGEAQALQFMGSEESGLAPTRAPIFIDGRPVRISRSLCRNIAIIEAMQTLEGDDQRYSFDQLLGISVTMPTAWRGVIAWSNAIGKTEPKNA